MKLADTKALLSGLTAACVAVGGVYLGSNRLRHFDPALFWYSLGSALAAFAIAYRFAVWTQRPPTQLYFKRGLQLLLRPSSRYTHSASHSAALTLGSAVTTNFAAQSFIRRRSVYRWIMHLCLSGGCTLAFAVTFPLVFGWVHFEPFADNAEMYRVNVFSFNTGSFSVHSAKAFLMFNLLNISAVIVMIGLVMTAIQRLSNAGERATQRFLEDILPLLLILAVTATGLMLTASSKFMVGRGHRLVGVAHLFSVLALLFYIPFGKLFHMFQRSCSLCVSLYKKAGATGARATCIRCGEDYASQMHVDDLKTVLDQLGFNYRFSTPHGEVHFQDICPACRRRLLALNQGRTVGR
jgi:hypothetical protein